MYNKVPYFVATFWISIYSATTNTNFVYIGHHLSELWKKQKGVFYETPCISCEKQLNRSDRRTIDIYYMSVLWPKAHWSLTFALRFHGFLDSRRASRSINSTHNITAQHKLHVCCDAGVVCIAQLGQELTPRYYGYCLDVRTVHVHSSDLTTLRFSSLTSVACLCYYSLYAKI